MEDSIKPNVSKNEGRYPLGMSSFSQTCQQKTREQFGQSIRLAMACIQSPSKPAKGNASPTGNTSPNNEASIRQRLKSLSQQMSSQHANLLDLLIKFDELQSWKSSGASHCAAWMNFEIGISLQLSWEYLRVGRKLQLLPILNALFRAGKLSWSKVRLISRVADQDSEPLLCHAALDASVSQVKRLCDEYRWGEDGKNDSHIKDGINNENDRALKQWDARSLTWSDVSNGNTRIQLVLPPEIAQAFLNSVEHSLNQLDTTGTDTKMAQRRADAAVLMAETSLQSAGTVIATADRYQVIVSVDASELSDTQPRHEFDDTSSCTSANHNIIPTKRPAVRGAGPIARETARRISCDCSLSIHKTANGEPIDIGRKSRIWPTAMERAIKERDQHCAWPGCTQSRHLHIHHIKHWADGGSTSISNGVCLCSHHHALVHEGGYTIQRVDNDDQRLHEQFVQQQHTNDSSLLEFATSEIEKALRNSRESFNLVRKLSPTPYRFRIVDAQGKDILDQPLDQPIANIADTKQQTTCRSHQLNQSSNSTRDSTRIFCGEPKPDCYYSDCNDSSAKLFTSDVLANYALTAQTSSTLCS